MTRGEEMTSTEHNAAREVESQIESAADYERRCSFDQPALDLALELERVFASEPKYLRVTKAQIAITELLMAKTAALAQSAASGGDGLTLDGATS